VERNYQRRLFARAYGWGSPGDPDKKPTRKNSRLLTDRNTLSAEESTRDRRPLGEERKKKRVPTIDNPKGRRVFLPGDGSIGKGVEKNSTPGKNAKSAFSIEIYSILGDYLLWRGHARQLRRLRTDLKRSGKQKQRRSP